VLDGALREIKRASAAEGVIALAFADDAARLRAEVALADRALIAEQCPPRHGSDADCEVRLADGVAPQRLLAALVGAEVSLRRFEVVTPSLHQIFVDRVGEAAAVAERRDA
jgi:ABC-2 type transport system ATP-binding protein